MHKKGKVFQELCTSRNEFMGVIQNLALVMVDACEQLTRDKPIRKDWRKAKKDKRKGRLTNEEELLLFSLKDYRVSMPKNVLY